MARTTDTDTREIKDLITGLREEMRSEFGSIREEMRSELGSIREEMRVGFSEIKGEIKGLDTRLIEVEKKIDKLDTRLWAFAGIALTATLGTLLTIFARYLFSGNQSL
jgi:hypothetical protein